MARSDFGGTANDFLYELRPFMRPTDGTLTFWDSATGGTQYTDLLLNGVAVSSITVPDSGFVPLFQGPDAVTVMWADEGVIGGARSKMVTTDGAAAAASAAAAAASAAAAAAVGSTNDTIMAGVVNNGASATRLALTRSGRKPVGQGENFINVRDYGVTGDGTTNDATNLDSAMLAASTLGAAVHIPAGNYLVSTSVYVQNNTRVIAAPGARIFGPRVGTHVMNVGSGSVIDGLTIENTDTTTGNICVNIRGASTSVKFRGCTFKGSRAQGISLGSAGCGDITITDCRFDGLSYGFLSNGGTGTGAWDLRGVTIANNVFTDMIGDAIEFNHPTTAPAVAGGFVVTGNRIDIPDRVGASSSSGFGIGVANCIDVTISNNYLKNCRNQGIHVEDNSANVTIVGNTVDTVDGTLSGLSASLNVGISIADAVSVNVMGNTVLNAKGSGYALLFNGTSISEDISVVGNKARGNVTGFSISGTTPGGHIVVANNTSIANSGAGFATSGSLLDAVFTGNVAHGNGGWGISTNIDVGYLRQFRDNVVYGNTLGDIQGLTTKAALVLHEKSVFATGTTGDAGANYFSAPAFRLGIFATGILHLSAGSGSLRAEKQYRIKWDGTTFRMQTLKATASGSITVEAWKILDGVLQLLVFTGTTGLAVRASGQFEGTIYEDGTAYTGTVTPTTQATALTAADASTVDTTYGTEEAAVINNLRVRVGELETAMKTLAGLS